MYSGTCVKVNACEGINLTSGVPLDGFTAYILKQVLSLNLALALASVFSLAK